MDIFKKLHFADYLSLTGLFFALISLYLILINEPNWAIIANVTAFVFDLLDGYFARKLKEDSVRGRKLDSFVDIFIYLIFSSLFFTKFLSPNILTGITGSLFILGFGLLRLIRFNSEGILKDKNGKDYYRGVTVVHLDLVVILLYFISRFSSFGNQWLNFFIVVIFSALMISNLKSIKIKSFWFFGLIITLLVLACLFLQYANY